MATPSEHLEIANFPISVTDVTVEFPKHSKISKAPDLYIGETPYQLIPDRKRSAVFQRSFEPVLGLSPEPKVRVITHYSRHQILKMKHHEDHETTSLSLADIWDPKLAAINDREEWKKTFAKFTITISFCRYTVETGLPPTTDDIFQICPRFRILVIGKAGVGKSTLINSAFGVEDAKVSKSKRGEADINREIFSKNNPHFVLHDSEGFEHGETGNLKKVTDFIHERAKASELKDQLHAIWLCIESPWSGNRVLERGDEEFIKGRVSNYEKVPIMVVFTKYDRLVSAKKLQLLKEAKSQTYTGNDISTSAKERANGDFAKYCDEVIKTGIKYAKVSKDDNETMTALVKLTYDEVRKQFPVEASIVTGIAQKLDIDLKIYLSIEVGRKKYWRGLLSDIAPEYLGRSLKAYLDVLHRDIIAVWNFDDPSCFLGGENAKKMMTDVVDDLADRDTLNPTRTFKFGFSGVAAVAGLVGGVASPAAPIVIPIVAGVAFAAWVYVAYQKTKGTSRCLLGYIVGLVIVMQHIFRQVETVGSNGQVDVEPAFSDALKEYQRSGAKAKVHQEIVAFVAKQPFQRADRDKALDKISELIKLHRPEVNGAGVAA